MHHVSGRWKLGLSLALLTAALWGLVPVALAVTLKSVDAYTITWVRFTISALTLAALLAVFRRLPALSRMERSHLGLLLLALIGLLANFVLFIGALSFVSPTVTQVVAQLAPILLMLGGVLFFQERFNLPRWLGFVLLLAGLLLFFNRRLPALLHPTAGFGLGVSMLLLASTMWCMYGLSQKVLLKHLQAQQVLLVLYAGSAILLAPFAHPSKLLNMTALQGWMLAFVSLNTVVAYGAFAEALRHWEASRVGATLALAPLFTIASMWAFEHVLPGYMKPDPLNTLSVVGALVVIGGSMLCALGNARVAAAVAVPAAPVEAVPAGPGPARFRG